MALWQGEPGTEPEGGDKSAFFRPFLYPSVKRKTKAKQPQNDTSHLKSSPWKGSNMQEK